MTARRPLGWGEPAPWFFARAPVNPRFAFSSLGGRFVALTFFGARNQPLAASFLETVAASDHPHNDAKVVSFGVSVDEADLDDPLIGRAFPHQRVFHDPTGQIAADYGLAAPPEEKADTVDPATMEPRWFILDPTLRVFAAGGLDRPDLFIAALKVLPDPGNHATPHRTSPSDPWAPVLLVPRVLEPDFCRTLIDVYRDGEPKPSGFMRTEDGRTVGREDPSFKRRADVVIDDEPMRVHLREAIRLRLAPEIKRAFQFEVTRIERYIVACYDAGSQGFFKPHRDNTTAATAHRRFAVSINLNAEDYDGGALRFPEFGTRCYTPPTGGAVVFSCSLLHEATPVTRGERFATLPFLYDDAAAKIRERNIALLEDGQASYRA